MHFGVGDVVSLKPESLQMPKLAPAQLILHVDFPNRFTVVKTETVTDLETNEIIHAIRLAECCGHIKVETGEYLCDSHPENLFSLTKRAIDPLVSIQDLKPDRETIIHTPIGPVLQLAHIKRENEGNVLLCKIPFLGPVAITGIWADIGAEAMKKYGLL